MKDYLVCFKSQKSRGTGTPGSVLQGSLGDVPLVPVTCIVHYGVTRDGGGQRDRAGGGAADSAQGYRRWQQTAGAPPRPSNLGAIPVFEVKSCRLGPRRGSPTSRADQISICSRLDTGPTVSPLKTPQRVLQRPLRRVCCVKT